MIIGLCGNYCAGKNEVAKLLEARGIEVVDVDILGHLALETLDAKLRVRARFGNGVFLENGEVNRRALGAIVFADPIALSDLESITHPAMISLLDEFLDINRGSRVCINAALLPRLPQVSLCKFAIIVRAPFLSRLSRAMRRDALGPLAALKRLCSQKPVKAQSLPRFVDIYSVENRGNRARLALELARVLDREGF
jgi:dephospho-CoA kinase